MTLYDCTAPTAVITAVGGDLKTHRRLVDMGLLGSAVEIAYRRGDSLLCRFGDFSATLGKDTAKMIYVVGDNENRALRKSECGQVHRL